MNTRDVKTIADARAIVEERGLTHIKVGLFDMDGVELEFTDDSVDAIADLA